MAKKKQQNNYSSRADKQPCVSSTLSNDPVPFSVRIPEELASKGKQCSVYHGISFNALICVALGEYLRDREFI
jgi:hypothetical protein